MLLAGFGPEVIYLLVALLIALTFHEASHALVAYLLGDDTPKKAGRLSLNPFAHLEPIGVLMILTVGLGWGKPVMINADKLKPNPKIGMALVAIAGPLSNILLGLVLALPLRLHLFSLLPERWINVDFIPPEYQYFAFGRIVMYTAWLCFALAIFNLIPFAPLDGSRLWQIILPSKWYYQFMRFELIGLFVIIGLILSDRFIGTNILGNIIGPPIAWVWRLLVGMAPPFPL
jgi:Zn-dependent protease